MKRKTLFLVALMLAAVLAISLTACLSVPGVTNPNNQNEDIAKHSVKYSFDGSTILTQTVTGGKFTEQQLAEKDALTAKGHAITGFFSDSAKTVPFNFDNKITSNTVVYCQVLYKVTYYYGEEIILTQEVDSSAKYLSQNQYDTAMRLGSGATKFSGFYRNPEKTQVFSLDSVIVNDVNVYCQLLFNVRFEHKGNLVIDQKVDALDGFTAEQIEAIENYYYNGFRFSKFYLDANMTNEFNFSTPPTRNNFTIYCDRDYTKAGDNVTWNISEDGTVLSFVGEGPMYAFRYHDSDVPWNNYKNTVTEIQIERGITTIANHAFYEFSKITEVEIPDTITFIGDNAFYKSTVWDINFPDSLKRIGENAFTECLNLMALDFNHGLESIGIGAFNGCTSVTTVVLTNTIILLGNSAFLNCNGIYAAYYVGTKEQYDEIVIDIDNFWLRDLAHTYYISQDEPTVAGPYWYYDDEGEIKQWYNTIWYRASQSVLTPTYVDYISVKDGVTQQNIDFMANIVYEGYRFAFWSIVGENTPYILTEGQVLEHDIKLLGNRGDLCGENLKWTLRAGKLTISKIDANSDDAAMWDFLNVTSSPWYGKTINTVELKSVSYIGKNAFVQIYNQKDLYSSFSYIDIPISVTSVNPNAFGACYHLLYIYYNGTPEQLAQVEGIDSLTNSERTVVYAKVNSKKYADYKEGAFWTTTKGDGTLTRRVAWSFKDGVLSVGGGDNNGVSYHSVIGYNSISDTPWYSYANEVTKVVIIDNITSIGKNCFKDMANVTDIVVPTRVTTISANTFTGTAYYNENYNTLGYVYVYSLTSNSGVKYGNLIAVNPDMVGEIFCIAPYTLTIAEGAFDGCASVKHLVFPKDIIAKAVFAGALGGLSSLEGIYYNGVPATWETFDIIPEGMSVVTYFYSSSKPTDTTRKYWCWNSDSTAPIIWEIET